MGKKKVAEMEKEETTFIHGKPASVDSHGKTITAIDGCIKRGVPEEVAHQIWNEMKDFAKYAFNKSHAAAYSLVTYQTAYLKCYYEPEFLTAVLNNRITNMDEIKNYVSYAKSEKIPVLPPDINESKTMFSVKDGKIRFGLAAVKGVGIAVIDEIIAEREKGGKFTSFEDFALRCVQYVNKRLVENLIYAGAFDGFGVYRSKLIAVYDQVLDSANAIYKEKESVQISIFDILGEPRKITVEYPNLKEYDSKTKLSYEKDVVGVYVTGHPLSQYEDKFKKMPFTTLKFLNSVTDEDGNVTYEDVTDGDGVEMGGIITSVKKVVTKSGQSMAILNVEDLYGGVECVLFPKTLERCKDLVVAENTVKIFGKLQLKEGRAPSVMIERMFPFEENASSASEENKAAVKRKYLGIKLTGDESVDEICEILAAYPGDAEVVLKTPEGKIFKASEKVRECNGIKIELSSVLDENNFIFYEK